MKWPSFQPGMLTAHQAEHLASATTKKLGSLGGSPGTGKTFTAARQIKAVAEKYGNDSIAIAAPTGKAAVRITEAMAEYEVNIKARTIHSLLGVHQHEEGGGWSFIFNRQNPLPYRYLVVDEASMIDTDLMADLLSARHRDCSVLLVGDVNQLPPVGHGAPLRDMIAAGIPCGELTEIHRNAGMIERACKAIRNDQPFEVITPEAWSPDDEKRNLVCTGGDTAEEQTETIKKSILAVSRHLNIDPVWDMQVLCPVKKGSELRTGAINPLLQDLLNNSPKVAGSPFRRGDKVICLKNGFYSVDREWLKMLRSEKATAPKVGQETIESLKAVNDRGEVYVANGEMGRVVSSDPQQAVVELEGPRRQVVARKPKRQNGQEGDKGTEARGVMGHWDLGYALTCHKAQGSEFPVVLTVLDAYPGAMRLCDRAWLYTAISRAKRLSILVGQEDLARRFVRVNNIDKRKTFLRQLIEQG